MQLTYSQLEDFFAEVHNVAPQKRIALKGRLKHFQRLGWPAGTNKGKGARVNYGIGQTMSLAIGMQMLELGLTPERVVEQLGNAGGSLAQAFNAAFTDLSKKDDPIFYMFDPETLSSLRDADLDKSRKGLQSMMVSASDLRNALRVASTHWTRRLALINMSEILTDYISYCADKGLSSPDALAEPLERWQKIETERFDRFVELMNKAATGDVTP